MSPLERKQVFAEFNHLVSKYTDDITQLSTTILNNMAETSFWQIDTKIIFPDESNFTENRISTLESIYLDVNEKTADTAAVLFGAWYYQLFLITVASVIAKKIQDYIIKHTGEIVKFKYNGISFTGCIINNPSISIVTSGGQPWDQQYYSLVFAVPSRQTFIDVYKYNDDKLQHILKLGIPVSFYTADYTIHPNSMNLNIKVSDLGAEVKEKYFNKIKEIVAKQI